MSKEKSPSTSSGKPFPLGSSRDTDGINFALYSKHGEHATLVLAPAEADAPGEYIEIPLTHETNRTGDIWHIKLHTTTESFRYGYKVGGREEVDRGILFFPDLILIDPYARKIVPRAWGESSFYGSTPVCLTGADTEFDWQDDAPPKIPLCDTIIYELHVRGFSRHSSSGVSHPGSYQGIVEKIPHLKKLGVTAVELLPVTEWDECDNRFINPTTGEPLYNYWGYNPISFFGLKSAYGSSPSQAIHEFKSLVKALHRENIEVIIDVVYNHSGESDYSGITSSFRGIDNAGYYLVNEDDGSYLNFSGCGNTFSCNNPVVEELILQSLRYWVTEMHVDGFRFDLAAIFSRDEQGNVIDSAPLIESIGSDPVLHDVKLIAEPWDASGLYRVGSFSNNDRWQEWNGRFRDDVRRFMAGHHDTVSALATRIAGSSDLYQSHGRGPLNSINFLTSHDGFTLYDLVSYENKHNVDNGENNRDGDNHNLSWNSGCEGSPCSVDTQQLRFRRIRTFAALLFLSQGVPMITAGDEFGRSQQGNNNSWCQDNEIGWVDWSLYEENNDLFRFFRKCIGLRRNYPLFRRSLFFHPDDQAGGKPPEITWQSLLPGSQDWSAECRTLAFILHRSGTEAPCDSDFFVMVNGSRTESAEFVIPNTPASDSRPLWHKIIDTAAASPEDIVDYEEGTIVDPQSRVIVAPMALIVLQSRQNQTQSIV